MGRLGDDLNPAEAIYEIITNVDWGCNYTVDRIDIESLVDLGITCEREELGISMLMTEIQQARVYINNIMTHINAVYYDNPSTGKLTFKCIRNDFDHTKLKRFDTTNCQDMEFTRLDWSQVTSSLSVKFTEADDRYNTSELFVNDLANRLITGSYTTTQIDGSYYTTPVNARFMAHTQLLSAGYPLAAISFSCNREGFDVTIGDPIIITWKPYGINTQIYRVTNVDYSNLTSELIKITAVEDVFSFDKTEYVYSGTPHWNDPEENPWDVARKLYLEMPYELTFSLNTELVAFAARPSNYTVYWDIWRWIGTNYVMTAKSSTWSIVGKMVYGFEEKFETDADGFEILPVGVDTELEIDNKITAINNNPNIYNNKSTLNLIVVDDEIMSYNSIEKLASGNYQLKGVMRGLYDTVPKRHSSESIVYFMDYHLDVNGNKPVALQGYTSDEQLEIKTESRTMQNPFDINDLDFMTTKRRSEAPSIMANLKFGADMFIETEYSYHINEHPNFANDILFTFTGRNKFSNFQILEQTDENNNITVSADTKNVISTHCNNITFETKYEALKSSFASSQDLYLVGDGLTYATGGWTWETTAQANLINYNVYITNLSQPTLNTSTALANFDAFVVANSPTACLLWLGADDLLTGNQAIISQSKIDFYDMVMKCLSNDIIPIVVLYTPTLEQLQELYNQQYTSVLPQTLQTIFTDYYNYCSTLAITRDIKVLTPMEILKTSNGNIDLSMYSYDKYHFSYNGAQRVGDYISSSIEYIFTNMNITSMRYKWSEFCKNMINNVSIVNDVEIEVKTYDEKLDLYSYDMYLKTFRYYMPRMIGIVTSVNAVQSFANQVSSLPYILINQSNYTPQLTVPYYECGLIFVGTQTSSTNGIIGQDGLNYDITSPIVYRIDGYDINTGTAIIHQIDLEEYYIFRSNYNTYQNNAVDCWQYRNNSWNTYIPY